MTTALSSEADEVTGTEHFLKLRLWFLRYGSEIRKQTYTHIDTQYYAPLAVEKHIYNILSTTLEREIHPFVCPFVSILSLDPTDQ